MLRLTTPTFLAVEHALIFLLRGGSHGDRLHHEAQEGVVWSVGEQSPKLPRLLGRGVWGGGGGGGRVMVMGRTSDGDGEGV